MLAQGATTLASSLRTAFPELKPEVDGVCISTLPESLLGTYELPEKLGGQPETPHKDNPAPCHHAASRAN